VRRLCALALVIAAIPAAAAFVPMLAGGNAARCEMACHRGASSNGASCCLLGADGGATLASCPGSRNGVPPAPVCRLFPPNSSALLPRPLSAASVETAAHSVRISRPSEPPDPVPIALA
jgi:hypothetical protein